MKRDLVAKDFLIKAPKADGSARVNVIGVIENQAPTKALVRTVKVESGIAQMDPANDICQIALVERHKAKGTVTNGFVSGFGYEQGLCCCLDGCP